MPRFERVDLAGFYTLDRRDFFKALGLGAGFFLSDGLQPALAANPVFKADPFSLGVASGDPAPDGFVIWTKLAPEPLALRGGMGREAVEVAWEVAGDEAMTQIVARGKALAVPELGHAVHVEVMGLAPDRDYFYRFMAGKARSTTGRSRTFPAVGGRVDQLSFALAGCQRYEDGYFIAWKHIARERFDFIVHYGDYIYEYKAIKPGRRDLAVVRDMPGTPGKCFDLADYRNRYALYKLDPDLQAAHASAPFLMSFDDHEVENNWAAMVSSEAGVPEKIFALRRAAAFQAWYEHMPLRPAARPKGAFIQAYRRLGYGDLVQIDVLDTRQYRSSQPCDDGWKICGAAHDPARTMLGAAQEKWLADGLRASAARWNLLAQQVPIARFDRDPNLAIIETHMDKWDGAAAARQRLFETLRDARIANAMVLSGDVHQNRAAELKMDFDDAASQTIGVEFTATSISSGGDGVDVPKNAAKSLAANPHLKFYNNQRGFVRHRVRPDRWQADFVVLDTVSTQEASAQTRASFVVEAGKPGLKPA